MHFPQSHAAGAIHNSTATSSTVLPTPLGANAKGNWTDVITATDFDASGLFLRPAGAVGGDARFMIDIAMDVAGQAQIIIENLYTETFSVGQYGGRSYSYFPIAIPKGTKLSARAQTSVIGYDGYIQLFPVFSGFGDGEKHARCITLGANEGTGRGLQIDPGASLDAFGSWYELSSSLPISSRWINIIHGSCGNAGMSGYTWRGQLGVGAAGAEVAVAEYTITSGSVSKTEGLVTPQSVHLPLNIAKGQRLAYRARTPTGTDATDRLFDVIAYLIG